MNFFTQITYDNYTLFGDVAAIAICAVITILLKTSYVRRTASYSVFMNIVGVLICAAIVNMIYHTLLAQGGSQLFIPIYVFRVLYQALLFDVFFLYILYITVVTELEHRKARLAAISATTLLVVIIGLDILATVMGYGFHIREDGTFAVRTNLFMIGYILFFRLLAFLLYHVRGLVYKRVMYGIYGTIAVSLLIWFSEIPYRQSSLTTLTFVLPAIALMYIMHSSPYNVKLGSVDIRGMEDMVRNMYEKKEPFLFMSLLLTEYSNEGMELPDNVRTQVRRFAVDYFESCVLFQIGDGHLVLIAPVKKNPDFEQKIQVILHDFYEQYSQLKHSYKIIIGKSVDEISKKNEYASLIQSVQQELPENTVHRIGVDDIARFSRNEYILQELADIYNKHDLDDPRVLAFCQPVFNIETGRFDTAEALMRLDLEKTGIVPPDQFIPMAENQGYIHVLTQIILHKTCCEIRRLLDEGYTMTRISVNVSVLELKDDGFCDDISKIIRGSNIPGDKVAIELTESKTESDFMIMKEKIESLRQRGIRFYLDDFGTGYSNMERIMELPFDIIKFDRSLVIASREDERSERFVENLAHMFKDMDYYVLYEGVESDGDEALCQEMSASYLQGFKYSKPIPIEKLRAFLPKAM